MDEQDVLRKALDEVKNGPFSILSDRAAGRLMSLMFAICGEAYERGKRDAMQSRAAKKKAAAKKGKP